MTTYYPSERDMEWANRFLDNLNYWAAQREIEREMNGEEEI